MIKIFTDGSSRGNPGPGGWGAIVSSESEVAELGGKEDQTTNNRMEMMAVIRALEYARQLSDASLQLSVAIYTDSAYVLNGATKWIFGWQKNNWKTAGKKAVLNQDLWEEMSDLLPSFSIKWNLLKGHAGIAGNERCDEIATAFAGGKKPKLYSGSLNDYTLNLSVSAPKTESKKSKTGSSGKKPYSYVSLVGGAFKRHATWAECEARVKGKPARFKKAFSAEDEEHIKAQWGVR